MSNVARMRARLFITDIAGNRQEDITDALVSGRVTMNQDANTQQSFEAEVSREIPLTYWQDFIQPELTVTYEDGTVISSTVGIYTVPEPNRRNQWRSQRIELDGRDLTYLLDRDGFMEVYSATVDDDPLAKVTEVIATSGVPLSRIRLQSRGEDTTRAELPSRLLNDRDWAVGTSKLTIINDLLDAIDYTRLYMDPAGRLAARPNRSISEGSADVFYASGNDIHGSARVIGDIEREPSHTSFANVIIVTAGSPTAGDAVHIPEPEDPPEPSPPSHAIGRTAKVTARIGLNLRQQPGTDQTIITVQPLGTMTRVLGGPEDATGYTWWRIESELRGVGKREGWSAENWLEPQEGDPPIEPDDPETPPPDPIVAIRVNDDPSLPTSVPSLGRRWIRFEEDTEIETQSQADATADNLLAESLTYYMRMTIGTVADPRRSMREQYDLDIRNRRGDVIADGQWYCRGWELGFTPDSGVMTHTCHRVEPWQGEGPSG